MDSNDFQRLKIALSNWNAVGLVLATVMVILSFCKWYSTPKSKLPPGPWGLPFMGYFYFLSKYPFKDFKSLAEKYGNIFSINLGGIYTVVLNDFESVKEAFNNPAIIDRPPNAFAFLNNGLGFVGHSGAQWVEQRRFSVRTFRDIGVGRSAWETSVESEVEDLVQLLEQQNGKPYNVYEPLITSVSNNVTRAVLGKPLLRGDPERDIVNAGIEGAVQTFNSSNLSAFMPRLMRFLAKLGLPLHAHSYRKLTEFNRFIKDEMERHKNTTAGEWNEENFIDEYLKEIQKTKEKERNTWFNESNLIGTAQSLLIAGSDPAQTYISWIFLAMAAFPEVQKKIQEEIDAVFGKDGRVNWSERAKLPYTYATMLEILRWRTVFPLGIVRWTGENTKIGGYDIPRGTSILPNFYSLHNDPRYWENPEILKPERFLDENGCVMMTRRDSYAPFSLGRRICNGEMTTMIEAFHYFTSIMQRFHIRPVEHSPPNITEGISYATYHPVHQNLRYILRE